MNKLYDKYTTDRSNGVRALRWTDVCNKLCASSHDASTVVDRRRCVVNKLDRRRALLTTRSTCRGEISESGVWDKVPE